MSASLLAHRIGDEWVAETPGREDRGPAEPDQIVAYVSQASREHLDAAAAAARAALPGWSATAPPARAEILFRAAALLAERAEAIGRDMAREMGKPITEAVAEARRAAATVREAAALGNGPVGKVYLTATPGVQVTTQRVPVGVVVTITPWSTPIEVPARVIAPALAAGCTVLFKPSHRTPLVGNHLVTALVDAGLPAGVLGMVFADAPLTEEAWVAAGVADSVVFTGSGHAAHRLRLAAMGHDLALHVETGGTNGVIVAPDADMPRAAARIIRSALTCAGQRCTATSIVIGYGGALEALQPLLAERVRTLRIGDPLDPATVLGPLVSAGARERVEAVVADAELGGARITARAAVPVGGAWHPPVVLEGVTPTMRLCQEEVFGPVIGLLEVPGLPEALRLLDQVGSGPTATIHTRDLATSSAFMTTARALHLGVNGEAAGGGLPGDVAPGGTGQRDLGVARYTRTRTILVEGLPGHAPFDRTGSLGG